MIARDVPRIALVALVGLLVAFAPFSARAASPDYARIDAYVEAERLAADVPGMALVVVEDGRIAHIRGFGDAASGKPVTPQTPFLLGSLSKSITAVAILELVEAKKIELDAPVRRYLPDFHVADPNAADAITVRQLLNQTSGFSTRTGRELYVDQDPPNEGDPIAKHVASLASAHLTAEPGSRFQYSNANYTTLGAVVGAASGMSYAAFVERNIFAPLQMRTSFTDVEPARDAGLAVGHRYVVGRPFAADPHFIRGEIASGYLISSAEDVGAYLQMHLGSGRRGDARLLSPEGLALLHHPAVPVGHDGTDSYAMGWFVWSDFGTTLLAHGGDTPSFHTDAVLVPEKKLAFALLFSANARMGVKSRIDGVRRGVTALLLGGQPSPPAPPYRYWGILALLAAGAARNAWGIRSVVARAWKEAAGPTLGASLGRRSLIRDAAWGLVLLLAGWLVIWGVNRVGEAPLRLVLLYQPDVGFAAAAAALSSVVHGALRLGLIGFRVALGGGGR